MMYAHYAMQDKPRGFTGKLESRSTATLVPAITLLIACASVGNRAPMRTAPNEAVLIKAADGSTFRSGTLSIIDYVTKAISPNVSLAKGTLDGIHGPTSNTRMDRIYFVLRGNAKIRVGQKEFVVEAGDSVFLRRNATITIEGNVEYLVINAPAFEPGYDR